MSEFANISVQGGGASHVFLNITVKLRGNLSSVMEQIDALKELQGTVMEGQPIIHNSVKFVPSCLDKDAANTIHERRVRFRMRVPIEYNAAGHRVSPTSIAGKYMDEWVHSIQYRNSNDLKGAAPIVLEPHHLKFAQYKLEPATTSGTQPTPMPATR